MFIGVLLVITWLILLLRYPAKALPVSVAAADWPGPGGRVGGVAGQPRDQATGAA